MKTLHVVVWNEEHIWKLPTAAQNHRAANRRSNTSNRKPTSGSLFNNIHVLVLKIEQWNCRLQLLAPQRAVNINASDATLQVTKQITSHPIRLTGELDEWWPVRLAGPS